MDKKFFVLDTNILLDSPNALFSFDDNVVILTEAVLDELDSFKKNNNDLGIAARDVVRSLEELRMNGSLLEGVKLNNNGMIKIEIEHTDISLPPNWSLDKNDHRILQVCKSLQNAGNNVILVTNDILLRIKSDIIGIKAEGFHNNEAPNINHQYTGRAEVYINDDQLQYFFENKALPLANTDLLVYHQNGKKLLYNQFIYPNQFILLKNFSGSSSGLGIVDTKCQNINALKYHTCYPYGLKPKNVGQRFMIEALMNDVPLTILKSPAGAGKTLFALAVGLERIIEQHEFRKMLIVRPNIELGGMSTLGYLPGTEREKIDPYTRSCFDNLEILIDSNEKERYNDEQALNNKVQYIIDKGYIEFQAMAFLRGRSILKQYMILDESQNTSPAQMKSIVTRIGEHTKLILCGDPQQIDLPFLSSTNNGLSWISEKMKGSPYCVQVALNNNECMRSELAKDVLQRLN